VSGNLQFNIPQGPTPTGEGEGRWVSKPIELFEGFSIKLCWSFQRLGELNKVSFRMG